MSPPLHLHGSWTLFCVCRIFLLCADIILLMFLVVLYEILMVFLLKIFLSVFPWGKHLSRICMNNFVMLDFTSLLNGGVNHIILRFLFLFRTWFEVSFSFSCLYLICSVYPASLSAFWYISFESLNSFSPDERLDSLFSIIDGNCFTTLGGWLDSVFMYIGISF